MHLQTAMAVGDVTPGHRTIEACVECVAEELRRLSIPGRYVIVLRLTRNCPNHGTPVEVR